MYPSSNTQSADPISQITDEAGRVTLQDGVKVAKTDAVAADIDAEIEEMMRENGIMEFSVLPADDPRRKVHRWRDATCIDNRGAIIQFTSHNCPDQATVIGTMRAPAMDAIYLLNWLEENEEAIKQRAINALMAHLKRCQSSLGLGEKLSQEDYSFSMMVQMGPTSKVHPTSRDEASLSILDYPHMVKYFPTSYDVNDDCERNVIINAYVHLLDPARRRVVAIRKMHEERVKQQQQPTQSQPQHATTPPRDSPRRPQHQPGPKPAKPAPYKYAGPYANSQSGGKIRKRGNRGRERQEPATAVGDLRRQLDETQRQLQQAQATNNSANFPNMKGGQPMKWSKTGEIPLTQPPQQRY